MEKANKEICSLVPAWSRLTHQTATLHYAAGALVYVTQLQLLPHGEAVDLNHTMQEHHHTTSSISRED